MRSLGAGGSIVPHPSSTFELQRVPVLHMAHSTALRMSLKDHSDGTFIFSAPPLNRGASATSAFARLLREQESTIRKACAGGPTEKLLFRSGSNPHSKQSGRMRFKRANLREQPAVYLNLEAGLHG